MSATHLALLRGINVGGKNKLPMKDLAAIFSAAGCENVQTFIQSGNVIFGAAPALSELLPDLISAQIATKFGHRPPVILRTAEQLRDVVLNNPFLKEGSAEDILHVLFLADVPSSHQVASLDYSRSQPDAFLVQGQEIYLQLPHGVADTKLTNAYFDSKLSTICTGRNWRTVTELLELMES